MSTVNEQEIRDRLHSALAAIPAGSPPAAAITGQGRGIRRRRWLSAGAALAAVIGLGAALPGLVGHDSAEPAARPAYHVTVSPPRPGAPAGLIGSGTINGRRWRVTLTGSGNNTSVQAPGTYVQVQAGPPASGDGPVLVTAIGSAAVTTVIGSLSPEVTTVTIRLAGGTVLTLRPVAYHGARYVAAEVPGQLGITRIVARGRAGELAYAVPFRDGVTTEIGNWLRPGQAGLPRASAQVGTGSAGGQDWTVRVHAGPWGVCVTGFSGDDCNDVDSAASLVPAGGPPISMSGCGPVGQSSPAQISYYGVARLSVATVRLTLASGSTLRLRPVAVDGMRFFAFTTPAGTHVTRWRAYDASGAQAGTGTGGWRAC